MARKYHEGDEPIPHSGYRLMEFLGRGGFGEVWKASAPGGTEAALKIIQLGGTEGRKEFQALQLVKKIRHTHLVPIFAFWLKNAEGEIIDDTLVGTAQTCAVETKPSEIRATMAAPPVLARPMAAELIIAMGLGDKSLYDRLQECIAAGCDGIPSDELLHYMQGAAEAIDFLNRPLHNLGSGPVAIQHCDIKPHNLMIVGDGTQVCDFGLARMMGADRTTTAAATLAYAAPECLVEGKPSASTDQYSLAVSYYELKTGVLPYRDETLAAVMDAKRQGKLDFSKLPAAEQTVLRRATSQNPADRFASSLEMVNALKRVAGSVSTTLPATAIFKPRKRGKLPLLLGILLLAVGGGGYVLMNHERFFNRQEVRSQEKPKDTVVSNNPRQDNPKITSIDINVPTKNELAANNQTNTGNQATANNQANTNNQTTKQNPELPPDPTVELLKSAKSLIEEKQWQAAMEKCAEAILKNPKMAEAYFLRGCCYLNLEPIDYDKAIADFEKAKSLDKNDQFHASADFAAAYLGRGTALLTAKRYDQAIADFTQAGRFAPRDYRIFSRLGVAWLSKSQWQQAVDAFTRSIEINPNEDTDFVNRGRAFVKLDQPDKAVEDFQIAAKLNPQNTAVQLQLGSAYIALKKPAQAIETFSHAIEEYAKSPEAKNMLAQAHLDRATAYLEVIDADPQSQQETNANYRRTVEDLTSAARLFEVEDVASLLLVHRLRRSCYEELKETEKAETEKSITAALRALEKNPEDAGALNDIAYYLATSANPEIRDNRQAVGFATRACELSQWKDPNHLDTLATAYAENGNFEEAAKWETKALELLPTKTENDKKKADEYRTRIKQYQQGKK